MSEPPTGELSDDKQPLDVDQQLGFEEAHTELEEIVRTLERGETSLERTLELWERGEKLYALCTARLDAAHGRVEELTRELEAQADDAPDGAEAPELEADTGRER